MEGLGQLSHRFLDLATLTRDIFEEIQATWARS